MVSISTIVNNFRLVKRAYHEMFVRTIDLDSIYAPKTVNFNTLHSKINKQISTLGYKSAISNYQNKNISQIAFWKLRNININRSVILLEVSEILELENLVDFIKSIKIQLGKATGYIPFLNEVGMQIIVISKNIRNNTSSIKPVDTYSNQKALIQSIFIIDLQNKKYYKANSVMQTSTGKLQNVIDQVIKQEVCENILN